MEEPRVPLNEETLGKAATDRRAAVRFSYFARVVGECAADTDKPFFEGRIYDLSLNGVGLIVYRPLEPGSTVSLTLYHAMGIFQCDRLVRVVDSRPEDAGCWKVNCEFLAPLSAVELRWFQVQDFSPRPGSNPS